MVRLAVFFHPETGALFSVKHPDRSAGAYAVRTRREESFHIFPCTDTSRRFDFYIFPDVFSEKCDIRQRSSCRTEPCGCLDIVRSAFRDTFAKTDFFFLCQITGFHNHFQNFVARYFFQDSDFFGNQIIIFIFTAPMLMTISISSAPSSRA